MWLLTDVCAAAAGNYQMRDDVAYVSTGSGACESLTFISSYCYNCTVKWPTSLLTTMRHDHRSVLYLIRILYCLFNLYFYLIAGRSGLVVGRPTAVREDPGSNLTMAGRVYHCHCDIQPWARVVHPYCSA